MSKEEARYQALASCGAALIAFIGVCHEFIGHIVFPWAPDFVGGDIIWHGMGILTIASGLLLLGGTLHLYRFPVVLLSILLAIIGAALVVIVAVLHHEFHMFALAVFFSGVVTAYCYPKSYEPTPHNSSVYCESSRHDNV